MGYLSTYQRALDGLFARTTGKSKFGLERTEALLEVLGRPHLDLPVFHVAGTNGKGSVCATLDTLLRAGGHRVGRYTSPHLVDFRERFLVDGSPIDEQFVVDFIARMTPRVEEIGATFFEATTAMAFEWFRESAVSAAVIETGLGGRLDSTNVVQPLAAAVTSIGLDHTEQLGDDIAGIAAEKAGIFKRGAAAVIGERDPGIAGLLEEHAQRAGASTVTSVWRDLPPVDITVDSNGTAFTIAADDNEWRLQTPLAGTHQASNSAVALAMLRAANESWWTGWHVAKDVLQHVHLPGRFHRVGRCIFDVAHNPDGARVLAATVKEVGLARPLSALLCVLADKDWRGVMRELAAVVDHFILTEAPTAPSSRAWDLAAAAQFARESAFAASVVRDFDDAIRLAMDVGATALITGSFHTAGDAMARLQVDPLAR
ncbi:MAG: bifunctional folylpolyglutamate synthase/dihydrofolate synthase [Gemmatimonadota bacterium]